MQSINPVRKWVVSLRIFSLPFIVLPYLLGVLVAVNVDGASLNLSLTLIGFIPMMLYHFAGTLQSDIFDFLKGIDKVPNRFSGGIVRKWISVKEATQVVVILYAVSVLSGIWLLYKLGMVFLPFAIFGSTIAFFYSAKSNLAFKYNVTGEWFIFICYGVVIPAYGYIINTGHLSFTPVLISIPAAFLMAAVKHANNWMAALKPECLEKSTLAYLFGYKASRFYFYLMIVLPYLLTGALIYWKDMLGVQIPNSMLIIYFSLPLLVFLFTRAGKTKLVKYKDRLYGLDSLTAALFCVFTFLCCAALFLV